jgi:purine-binding chemotaxis protein CheW
MPAPRHVEAPARPVEERLVCFWLGEQLYGAPIRFVRETVRLRPITRVFHTPDFIVGLASLRGEILAVLDIARLLGLPPTPLDHDTHILIVECAKKRAGLLADRLSEVRDVEPGAILPPPPTLDPAAGAILRGVVSLPEAPLGVVDLERVFASDELRRYERKGAS